MTSLSFTRKGALAALESLNPRDALKVIKSYAAVHLVGTDGGYAIEQAVDQTDEELFPSDPDPRFVSSDYSYEVRAGIHGECR